MELFVLRHGHAESHASRDQLRALTAGGKQQVESTIRANKKQLVSVQSLLVSPYLRAQQTAKIAADELDGLPFRNSELLVPGAYPSLLIQHLHELYHQESLSSLLLVSHQPLVSVLIGDLCGTDPIHCSMSTASLAAIDFDVMASGCCKLRWIRHVG